MFFLKNAAQINPCLIIECRQELFKVLSEVTAAFSHTKQIRWEYGFYCPHALQSGERPHATRCLTMDEPWSALRRIVEEDLLLLTTNTSAGSWRELASAFLYTVILIDTQCVFINYTCTLYTQYSHSVCHHIV